MYARARARMGPARARVGAPPPPENGGRRRLQDMLSTSVGLAHRQCAPNQRMSIAYQPADMVASSLASRSVARGALRSCAPRGVPLNWPVPRRSAPPPGRSAANAGGPPAAPKRGLCCWVSGGSVAGQWWVSGADRSHPRRLGAALPLLCGLGQRGRVIAS